MEPRGCPSSWAIELVSADIVARRLASAASARFFRLSNSARYRARRSVQKGGDEEKLNGHHAERGQRRAAIFLPQAGSTMEYHAVRRQTALGNTPPPQFTPVEDWCTRPLWRHFDAAGQIRRSGYEWLRQRSYGSVRQIRSSSLRRYRGQAWCSAPQTSAHSRSREGSARTRSSGYASALGV